MAGRVPLFTAAFVLLWFVGFFQEMAYGLMVHLPGFFSSIGAGEAAIGAVFSVAAAVSLALRPVMGRLIDHWGRKRVMLLGGVVLATATAAYIPISTFGPPVFAVRTVYMAVEILLFTTLLAIGADLVPESRRVQGMGILGISGLLPIGFGSILGDIVVVDDNFKVLFAISAILALTSWSLAWRLPDIRTSVEQKERYRGFGTVVRQRDLIPVWIIAGSFALGMVILFTFLRTFVDATGIGSVGRYFGVYAGVAVVARVVGGSWADRLGTVRMLIPAMAAMVVQYAVLAVADTATVMTIAAAFGGFGHGLVFPILTTLVVDRASLSERGTALAIFSGLFDAVILAGAPLVGLLIESSGYSTAFAAVGTAVAVGVMVFLWWDRRTAATDP